MLRWKIVILLQTWVIYKLSYLQAKTDSSAKLFGEYILIDDDNLKDLFLTDGAILIDYKCFGDVLMFNTIYKKNKYNKPLVIFSGTNNHAQITIFVCALLLDETI